MKNIELDTNYFLIRLAEIIPLDNPLHPSSDSVCSHLIGTYSYLTQWQCSKEMRLAYLFSALDPKSLLHAVTLSPPYTIDDLYAETQVQVSLEEFRHVLMLALANWLEQRARIPKATQEKNDQMFLQAMDFFSEAAKKDFKKCFE